MSRLAVPLVEGLLALGPLVAMHAAPARLALAFAAAALDVSVWSPARITRVWGHTLRASTRSSALTASTLVLLVAHAMHGAPAASAMCLDAICASSVLAFSLLCLGGPTAAAIGSLAVAVFSPALAGALAAQACALYALPRVLPRSFAAGEAVLVVQLLCLGACVWRAASQPPVVVPVLVAAHALGSFGLGCVALAVALRWLPAVGAFCLVGAASALTGYLSLSRVLAADPVHWLMSFYVLATPGRPALLAAWGGALALFLALPSISRVRPGGPARIVVRKAYHVLAVVLFAGPALHAASFTGFCLAGATLVFGLAELVRGLRVPPLGNALHAALAPLVDERDAGPAVLTHVYLLLGCAAPLWLSLARDDTDAQAPLARLARLSGVLVLGVGDAAASVCGVHCGRTRWPGLGSKTVEGSLGGLAAMALACAVVVAVGPEGELGLADAAQLGVALVAALALEAVTSLVDNLVLPLYFWALLAAAGSQAHAK